MTCREKLAMEHPELRDSRVSEVGCPHKYGYLPIPDGCGECGWDGVTCSACWDRDIPETPAEESRFEKAYRENPERFHISIKDSGNRRQFDTGAVRDMQEGKGRCDLMPLEVVANMYKRYDGETPPQYYILMLIKEFLATNETRCLYEALHQFASNFKGYSTMFLEVAKHFEEGAKKYGPDNWRKGIPAYCYMDSAIRHYLKWLRKDNDEPHDRAFVWNLMCCIWEVDYREKENDND